MESNIVNTGFPCSAMQVKINKFNFVTAILTFTYTITHVTATLFMCSSFCMYYTARVFY